MCIATYDLSEGMFSGYVVLQVTYDRVMSTSDVCVCFIYNPNLTFIIKVMYAGITV